MSTFNSYEFSFAGISSLMFDLMLYDIDGNGQENVPFGNRAEIVGTRTMNRIHPLHFGVNYHAEPLQFKLVFGCDHAIDRYDMENISFWLTGHQDYQWLSIDQPDMAMVQFRCLITELTPLSFGWLPVAFEAQVICDCPYAYGFPFSKSYNVNGSSNILFRNESSMREHFRPDLVFIPSGASTSLTIVNHSDNDRTFQLDGIPSADCRVVVDNRNGILQDTKHGHNLYPGFNLNFFRLVHGDNQLEVTGDGQLTISGRFLHNVAG